MTPYGPVVLCDRVARPLIVYAKGRKLFHAVAATENSIRLITLETLRGLAELKRNGEPYPPRRAAGFWLNHDFRPITDKRAARVLRALVRRRREAPPQ